MAKMFRAQLLGRFATNQGTYPYKIYPIFIIARSVDEVLTMVNDDYSIIVDYLSQKENVTGYKIMDPKISSAFSVGKHKIDEVKTASIREALFNGQFQKISQKDVHLLPVLYPECFI